MLLEILKKIIPDRWHPRSLAIRALQRASAQGTIVIGGPFRGMHYVNDAIQSAWHPKILGTYELELHSLITSLCRKNFHKIINVGAGEGYYAIGMAIAKLNSVENRVIVQGTCNTETLNNTLDEMKGKPGSCLLIMDVDGGELSLLVPELVPALKQMCIVVELHDCWFPGLDSEIESRFKATHRITRIWSRPRTAKDLPIRPVILDHWLLRLTNEFRPEHMSWLYLEPSATNGAEEYKRGTHE